MMRQSLKRPRSSITLLSIAGILISIQSVLQLNLVQFGLFDFNSTQQNSSHSENVSESSRLDNNEEEADAIEDEEADIFYRRYLISNAILENNNDEIVEDFDTAAEYAQQDSTSTLHLPNPNPDELASSNQLVVQPYSLSDALYESSLWEYTFCILVYDPSSDKFIALYNKDHQWKNGNRKLWKALRKFTYMLRRVFPTRFTSTQSELVIPIGSGDYPHVIPTKLPHTNGVAPVLMFGSAFRDPQMYSNMIAMPMPENHHLDCFLEWVEHDYSTVCDLLQSGALIFGEEEGLEYDSLIPWRGTDFGYLPTISRTSNGPAFSSPNPVNFVRGSSDSKNLPHPNDIGDEHERRVNAIQALNDQIDTLLPRWKGVAITAEAELEAEENTEDENAMPWANIKFSAFLEKPIGKQPTIGSDKYAAWESVGIAVGQGMPLTDLAKYKYHIDLGGGGGTTWSGTIEKLAMPGLLFHHMTPTKDYIHDHLKPWKHYIPVNAHLSDLKQKFDWAESHPQQAKRISDAGTTFMRELGTPEGFGKIFELDFVEPIQRVIDAYQPVAEGMTWRDVLSSMGAENRMIEVMECTGTSYNYNSCQMIGGEDVERFQSNGYYEEVE